MIKFHALNFMKEGAKKLINCIDSHGKLAIHYAAESGHSNVSQNIHKYILCILDFVCISYYRKCITLND